MSFSWMKWNRRKQQYLDKDEKGEYIGNDQTRLRDEVEILSMLADYYLKKGKTDPHANWTDILKAHALYNSCAARSTCFDLMMFNQKVKEVQNLFFMANKKGVLELKSKHQIILERIRGKVRLQIAPLRKMVQRLGKKANAGMRVNQTRLTAFCGEMQRVSLSCSDKMIQFSKTIISDCIRLIDDPPCSFTAVAKGSLARGEATPYSDLEFFFIIETKTKETLKYFVDLAMTIYFVIGNLRETKLKYMNIRELDGWFDDEEVSGIKIDGLQRSAGNIPTGNGVTNRKNKYIVSLGELIEKYDQVLDKPIPKEAIDGDDSAMVAFTREIYSYTHRSSRSTGSSLLSQFVSHREIKRMNKPRRLITQEMLENDLKRHGFDPDDFTTNDTVEVKPKIYRFPSLVTLDLAILHELYASSSWDSLTKLSACGKISSQVRSALQQLLAMASYIRMCTYLYHKSQSESMALPMCKHRKGGKGYLVSRRLFTALIIYMCSMTDEVILEGSAFTLFYREGTTIVDQLCGPPDY